MSHFFEGIDDSDEELQEVEEIEEVEDDDVTDSKWFQPDDDEDEDEDEDASKKVKSKKERTSDEVQEMCDEMDFDIEVNWAAAFKKFLTIIDKSRKYITSEGVPPVPFLQCLVHLQESLAAQQDTKKDDYEDVKEYTSLRQMMKKHNEIYEEFEFHCKKLQAQEEDEAAGDKNNTAEKEEPVEEWTEESMIAILGDINVAAKKNRASRSGEVAKHAKTRGLPHIAIAALALQCTALMEEDTREAHVTSKVWVRALECANEAFVMSEKNKKITVVDRLETNADNYTARRTVVTGGFSRLVARLHQEFVLACSFAQKTNPEYIERVKEEKKLQIFASNVLRHYTRKGTKRFIAEVSLVILQIVAPRTKYAHELLTADTGDDFLSKDSMELTANLAKSISENTPYDTSACLHASLLEAYQTALSGKYYECLDLSLRRRLQESVQTAEKKLRLLYNRVTAQMGIAAFRCGQYLPAFHLLNPLVQPRNQELLLGQRAIRYRSENVDPKVEFERRKLLVPPHHHIACDVVELICVLSTMIVEGVSAAKKPFKYKKRDENFLTMLESQKSGSMIRDKYVAASKAFKEGAVKDTWDAIMSIDAMQDIPDADVVIPQVHKRIKEDALRVFIINNAKSLDSLAVEWMCEMFELNADEVKVTVTQLLLDHEAPLVAFWDETEEFLLIERSQTTRLHHLAASLADKVASLPTQSKSGSHGYGRGRGRGGYRGGRGVSTN